MSAGAFRPVDNFDFICVQVEEYREKFNESELFGFTTPLGLKWHNNKIIIRFNILKYLFKKYKSVFFVWQREKKVKGHVAEPHFKLAAEEQTLPLPSPNKLSTEESLLRAMASLTISVLSHRKWQKYALPTQ